MPTFRFKKRQKSEYWHCGICINVHGAIRLTVLIYSFFLYAKQDFTSTANENKISYMYRMCVCMLQMIFLSTLSFFLHCLFSRDKEKEFVPEFELLSSRHHISICLFPVSLFVNYDLLLLKCNIYIYPENRRKRSVTVLSSEFQHPFSFNDDFIINCSLQSKVNGFQ